MEKITTKAELLEQIESVKAIEVEARKGYVDDVGMFTNKKIKETIQLIKEDEDKHIQLLDELIDLLKK